MTPSPPPVCADRADRAEAFRPLLRVGVSVLLFVLVLGVAAWRSYRDLDAARERQRQLEIHVEETRNSIDELHGRIERLRSDPGTLERLAREDLGMVRPGDVVIELPVAPAAPAAKTRPPAPH